MECREAWKKSCVAGIGVKNIIHIVAPTRDTIITICAFNVRNALNLEYIFSSINNHLTAILKETLI